MSGDDRPKRPILTEGIRRGAFRSGFYQDLRAHPRVASRVPVDLLMGDHSVTGATEDLSEGGALVEVDAAPPLGSVVLLNFRLGEDTLPPIRAEVVRHRPPNPHAGIKRALGLRFQDARNPSYGLLRAFVRDRVREIIGTDGAEDDKESP